MLGERCCRLATLALFACRGDAPPRPSVVAPPSPSPSPTAASASPTAPPSPGASVASPSPPASALSRSQSAAPSPASASPAAPAAASPWAGEPIAATVVHTAPARFALGDDVMIARQFASGWVGTKFHESSDRELRDDLFDQRGVIATAHSFSLVVADSQLLVLARDKLDGPARISRLVKRKLLPLRGTGDFRWAAELGGHLVAIGNDASVGLDMQHWQTYVLDRDRLVAVETPASPHRDYATGAARLGAELVVATREHDRPSAATVQERAAAITASERGDHRALAQIGGETEGYLLHVDARGHVTRRDPFGPQAPHELAALADGTLVIATEGTLAHGLQDAALLVRRRDADAPTLLARDLAMPGQLMAAGEWACLDEMPGDTRVVHCVNPARKLHVRSEPLSGTVTLLGIEAHRVIVRQTSYRGAVANEQTLELALP